MARRGTAWAHQTPDARFAAMRETLALAKRDLERALVLRPRAAAAASTLLQVYAAEGDRARIQTLFDDAIERCPDCVELRVSYLRAVRGEWAGQPGQLDGYLRQIVSRRSALKVFDGYLAYEECYQLRRRRRYPEARTACDRAVDAATYFRYHFERGRVRREQGDYDGALDDLDEALRLRPQHPGSELERVLALVALNRAADAAEQLVALVPLLIDDPRVLRLVQTLAPSVSEVVERALREGRQEDVREVHALLQAVGHPVAPLDP